MIGQFFDTMNVASMTTSAKPRVNVAVSEEISFQSTCPL